MDELQMSRAEYARLVRRTRALFAGQPPRPHPCKLCSEPNFATTPLHLDYRKPYHVWWLCGYHHTWQKRPRGTQFLGQFGLVTFWEDEPQPIAACGTVARYKHKRFPCHCLKCTNAWRLYKKLYRRNRKIEFGEQAAALRKQGRFAESELVMVTARNKS